MKKLMSLMFVAGLSLTGLVACGGNETKNPETSKPISGGETDKGTDASTDKVEIKLWLDDDTYAEKLTTALETALPNIKIVYENVGSASTRTKLELDGPAGVGADVFIQPHDNMAPSIEGNILLPIGADLVTMIEDRMLEGSVATVKTADNYYGVPLSTESLALFYNQTLLDENELTLATTFEEIVEQAKVYNNPSQNKFIFRFQPGNAYDNHMFLTAAGFELYGPNHIDPSMVNFNTPEVVKGLESFASLKEILDVPYADLNWDSVHGEFVNGNVPYMIGGPWEIGEIREGSISNEFEWGITTIPTINGQQPYTFSGNIIACISAYTKYPAEARQVIDFLSSEEGLQILFDTTGRIPALKDASVINGVMEDPYVSGILAQAQYSQAMPTIVEFSKYWGPAETMFRSVWDRLSTPEQAAAKALDDYNTALQMTE